MTSSLKNYIHYVQNVLGVKKVFYKSSSSLSPAGLPKTELISAPLILSIDQWAQYTDEENELLNKMISALKMETSVFRVIDQIQLTQVNESQVQKFLHFIDEPERTKTHEKNFYTYSPRRLLKEPGLKKEAWNVMQAVTRKLQLKS